MVVLVVVVVVVECRVFKSKKEKGERKKRNRETEGDGTDVLMRWNSFRDWLQVDQDVQEMKRRMRKIK